MRLTTMTTIQMKLLLTWHMKLGMTLWKAEPLKPKPFSPVHRARKFSAVLGTMSARSWKRID